MNEYALEAIDDTRQGRRFAQGASRLNEATPREPAAAAVAAGGRSFAGGWLQAAAGHGG
jgi:hypothetical protein